MEEECTRVSGDGGKSNTSEGTGPNKKRIIPGTDNQWGDEKRRMRNALEFSALFFFFYSIWNRVYDMLFLPCIGAGAVWVCVLLWGVLWRLRMLVHGGFTHYPGPAASWGANQDDQREPQPAQAPMIFTSSRLMYSSTVYQSLSHIDPPLNEPSPLCTMSNN